MDRTDRPIANPIVVLREEFDDWAVLFDPDTGHGFGLNPTGVYIWKLLDGQHSIDDMLTALRRGAEEVPQEAGEHLIAFVQELAEQSLAGWEGERIQDCRRRISPCPTCTGTTKFNYEPPKLVNLSGERAAHGYCGDGSGNTSSCAVGNGASVNCGSGNYPEGGAPCDSGISPTSYCCGGSTLSNPGCLNGSTTPTGCCEPGSSAGLSE